MAMPCPATRTPSTRRHHGRHRQGRDLTRAARRISDAVIEQLLNDPWPRPGDPRSVVIPNKRVGIPEIALAGQRSASFYTYKTPTSQYSGSRVHRRELRRRRGDRRRFLAATATTSPPPPVRVHFASRRRRRAWTDGSRRCRRSPAGSRRALDQEIDGSAHGTRRDNTGDRPRNLAGPGAEGHASGQRSRSVALARRSGSPTTRVIPRADPLYTRHPFAFTGSTSARGWHRVHDGQIDPVGFLEAHRALPRGTSPGRPDDARTPI